MLKQTQSQRLVQKVLPQLIQKMSLLAIPTIALEQMVRLELIQNPFLEERELETLSEDQIDSDVHESDDASTEESNKEEEYNWDDYLNSDTEGYKTPGGNSDDKDTNYENMWRSPHSKNDILLSQVYLSELNHKHMLIAEAIIRSLDDDGYFRQDINEFVEDLKNFHFGDEFKDEDTTASEVEKVLQTIQKFDPPGIASRNLQECLINQINQKDLDPQLKTNAQIIIRDYFEEFRLKNYEKLVSELNIDINTLNKIFDLILKLNPKPAASIEDAANADYIFPDLIVLKENGIYKVELNERNIPSLRINSAYRRLITNQKNILDKNTKDFIHNNFERAKWFLMAINSRRETMLKVMNAILKHQKEFFDNLGEGLKPLYEKDVAEDIGMDISTVSRTVRGKYVQSEFGIYELRNFFSHKVRNEVGEDISNSEIKNKLKEVIESEDPANPLTDEQLVIEMHKLDFKLARRTVAKYRDILKIPKARMRRKL
ncbi:MAG TPA: RNA polymerase factor sigma-54 [Ignavibacteria bacterium]